MSAVTFIFIELDGFIQVYSVCLRALSRAPVYVWHDDVRVSLHSLAGRLAELVELSRVRACVYVMRPLVCRHIDICNVGRE